MDFPMLPRRDRSLRAQMLDVDTELQREAAKHGRNVRADVLGESKRAREREAKR